jgi:hypothetical protein
MHFSDDLYLGAFLGAGLTGLALSATQSGAPQLMQGFGPLGRYYAFDIVPLTLQTANIAALQAPTINVPLILTAGTGVTQKTTPSGTVYFAFDVCRAVSLTSAANLSGVNFTITGLDFYNQLQTVLIAGPNVSTVTTTKTFNGVISVVPSATNAGTVSVGSSDVFGMPVVIIDAGYTDPSWNNQIVRDVGVLVVADATSPATSSTGDVRGTYKPSSASNGVKRLVIDLTLTAIQVGPNSTRLGLLGVTPA